MVSADTSFYQDESVLLTASGANTYVWSPSLGLNSINGSSVEASPDETTTYCVTGYNGNFCSDTACVVLTRLFDCNDVFIPTIFSPNGKGPEANETLCLFSNCVDQLKFVIHNRWGQKVFETEDINSCWDGTFNGQAVQSGVYAFNVYLRQLDGAVINKTGTISLVK
jgi:gliding motility-associated-like protein